MLFCVGSSDGMVILWDLKLGRSIHTFEERDVPFSLVRFCCSDQYLVASAEKHLYLFK